MTSWRSVVSWLHQILKALAIGAEAKEALLISCRGRQIAPFKKGTCLVVHLEDWLAEDKTFIEVWQQLDQC